MPAKGRPVFRTSHSSAKQQHRVDPYLIGILYGDGTSYASKNGAYAVWIDQVRGQLLRSKVVPRLRRMSYKVHFYDYTSKADGSHKWRALVYSKNLFLWFREMRRKIIIVVEGMTNRDFRDFLAGFFDAEGTRTDRLVIYNKNQKLLSVVRRRLRGMGISGHIYRYGRVHGIQIYRKLDVEKFSRLIPSYRLRARVAG